MESFKAKRFQDFPKPFQEFFFETQLYIEIDNWILVHAGLNFEKSDLFEDREALLWARNTKVNLDKLGTRKIVHGHTPIPLKKTLIQKGPCFNIDGGCVFKNSKKNLGQLVALDLDSLEFYYTECID